MKTLLIAVLFFLFGTGLSAQKDSWISTRLSTGAFLPHRESLPQLRTGKARGIELNYTSELNGSKDWHHHFNGLKKGIGVYIMDMGNPKELGSIYSLYPFIDMPLDNGGPGRLMLHMGVGIAYLDKQFDYDENFYNKAIGSHVNYSIVIGLHYLYSLERFKLGTGLSVTHASNAALQLPNLGVNVASFDLTIGYRLNREPDPFVAEPGRTWFKNQSWMLMTSFGMRESNAVTREKHAVEELRGYYTRKYSPKSSYRMGFDLIHNKASYQDLDDGRKEDFGLDALQWGLFLGIGLEFGDAQLYFNNGFYIAQGFQDQGLIYHRFGGLWKVNERLSLDLSLKTHFVKADYLALGIGYSIASKKLSGDE